jgi:hypothetical protein
MWQVIYKGGAPFYPNFGERQIILKHNSTEMLKLNFAHIKYDFTRNTLRNYNYKINSLRREKLKE